MNSINLGQLGSLDWRVAAHPVPAAGEVLVRAAPTFMRSRASTRFSGVRTGWDTAP